uniref:Trichome birefringence-like C-terminal domain-containing protein n=1 Tax=Helicotheca tamesis TaxID=374047 RepID=A0A7S2MAZ8_9STRA
MGLWNRVVDCPYPYNNGESFEISFVRNDNLNGNNDAEVTQENVDFPWIQNYASYNGRTLLVASTGAHQHHVNAYRAAVDNFVTMMDQVNRNDDIIVYRTAAPGHRDCSESTAGRTDTVGVDKFTDYNNYMLGKLHERDRVRRNHDQMLKSNTEVISSSPSVTSMSHLPSPVEIRPMDIFPMTLLHPHGKEGVSTNMKKKLHDCQHDYLPGPPDGWNHMLYTTLVDLVNEKRTGERHPLW